MSGGPRPRRVGGRGEQLAEAFLAARGYLPLARNHHSRTGEVDLIVGRGELVVFVEVKLRRRGAMVDPLASVTPVKQRRIIRAALDFVQRHRLEDRAMRFDVVTVTPDRRAGPPAIDHFEAAFDSSALDDD